MPIKSLELAGLRGFALPQSLSFAMPSGAEGSGLTILIGPNNGGKSTIVESLRAMASTQNQSFTEGKRNKETGDRVSIVATLDTDSALELRTVDAGGSETVRTPNNQRLPFTLYVLPSRRYFNPYFGRGQQERQAYATNVGFPQSRGAALDQFSGRLFRVLEKRAAFDAVLRRVLDPPPDWTIDQADGGQYYLKFSAAGQYHTSDGLGEGIVSLFFLVDALYDSEPGEVIVIDEPELSLHPAFQRRLAALLADYAKDRQILYATHSPYFVDFNHVASGAEVARVHKPAGASVISRLGRATADKLRGFLSNANNPHILGLDAREALFVEDGLVLVEGQEDVVFYSRLLREVAVDLSERFFGWGVGGADNIPMIAGLLSDLGFEKVAAILDANKKHRIDEFEKLFPKYRFVAIPADDVRTKPERPAQRAVHGLLDEAGELRPEFEKDTRTAFDIVQRYFAADVEQ
ncbi:MAG: ATP-binding protein [Deltaproteobacteria bacterium]|nr:ATP-binding protein [Deltaproteobacteria bacterium]